MSMRGVLFAALLVLLVLLLLEIAGLRYWLQQHAPDARDGGALAGEPGIEPLLQEQLGRVVAMPDPGTPAELIERPLFAETRRPRPPEEEPDDVEPEETVEKEPLPELEITLRSVVLGPDTARVWIQPEGDERLVRLSEGDTYEGWTLTSVARDRVVFTSEDRSRDVSLRPERSRQLEIERVRPQPMAPRLP